MHLIPPFGGDRSPCAVNIPTNGCDAYTVDPGIGYRLVWATASRIGLTHPPFLSPASVCWRNQQESGLDSSPADRITFWTELQQWLAAVHARIPHEAASADREDRVACGPGTSTELGRPAEPPFPLPRGQEPFEESTSRTLARRAMMMTCPASTTGSAPAASGGVQTRYALHGNAGCRVIRPPIGH
jgi:hypothetical protein